MKRTYYCWLSHFGWEGRVSHLNLNHGSNQKKGREKKEREEIEDAKTIKQAGEILV